MTLSHAHKAMAITLNHRLPVYYIILYPYYRCRQQQAKGSAGSDSRSHEPGPREEETAVREPPGSEKHQAPAKRGRVDSETL